ncbi:MAG: hypothetical protein ACP5JA_08740 [Thermodesulfovibrio sp.]
MKKVVICDMYSTLYMTVREKMKIEETEIRVMCEKRVEGDGRAVRWIWGDGEE